MGIEKLSEMYRCVYDIQLRLKQLQQNGGKNAANISVKAKNKKMKEANDDNNNKKVEEAEDVEMKNENVDDIVAPPKAVVAMDEDTAMAMALSMSMQGANIDTPAIEKKAKKQTKPKSTAKKSKKKSTKKNSKKRKKMDGGDEEYVPGPAKKRSKTN